MGSRLNTGQWKRSLLEVAALVLKNCHEFKPVNLLRPIVLCPPGPGGGNATNHAVVASSLDTERCISHQVKVESFVRMSCDRRSLAMMIHAQSVPTVRCLIGQHGNHQL